MADIVTNPAAASAPNAQTSSKPAAGSGKTARGLEFSRHFTKPGVSPFDELTWEKRDAIIQDFKGKIIFEQKDVETPSSWSVTATNIVASQVPPRPGRHPRA